MSLLKKITDFNKNGMAGVKRMVDSQGKPTHYVGNGGYNGYERIVTNKTFNPVHGSASNYNYGAGTGYGSSSSYTPPNYSDYVRNTDLTKAPAAPTFSAAPRAQSVSSAPKAKANTEEFNSKWSDELQAMYDQIANRPKFSYDQNSDPLYQQYAEMYRKNAQLAMDDTVARAASLTGGYGNSYAETAGQAMYNQQMDNLNQRALDLYYAALDTYDKENQNMYQKFNLAGQMYNNDYNAWRARVADDQWAQNFDFNAWQADVANQQWAQDYNFNAWQADNANAQWRAGYDFDAWQANNENQKWQTQFDYDRYINDRNFGYNQFVDDRNYNYQLGRDAINDSRYDTEWQHQLEREGIEDERYADELSYSRWRDYIGDMRYDDETKYNRLQDSLDRNLQYYQAGYDPLTGGMSEEARQQYELNLRAQGIDPATGGRTPQAMLEYLAANGNDAGIDAYVDGLTGLSKAQKDQMKAMYHSNSAEAAAAKAEKKKEENYKKAFSSAPVQGFIKSKGVVEGTGAARSQVMDRDTFNQYKGQSGKVPVFGEVNGKTEHKEFTDYDDYWEWYMKATPWLTEDQKEVLYDYYTG